MNEEDFASKEVIEKEIEGKTFKFRCLTGGDTNEILDKYVSVDEEGIVKVSASRRNEEFVKRAVVEAPYECFELDGSGTATGAKKAWEKSTLEERLQTLKQLRPGIFSKIVQFVLKLNEVTEDEIKK